LNQTEHVCKNKEKSDFCVTEKQGRHFQPDFFDGEDPEVMSVPWSMRYLGFAILTFLSSNHDLVLERSTMTYGFLCTSLVSAADSCLSCHLRLAFGLFVDTSRQASRFNPTPYHTYLCTYLRLYVSIYIEKNVTHPSLLSGHTPMVESWT